MPRMIEQTMMPSSASSRLVATTLLITALKSVAIPVCWTTPIMIPTQALAATSDTPFLAARPIASSIDGRHDRSTRPNANKPTVPRIDEFSRLPITARRVIALTLGSVHEPG